MARNVSQRLVCLDLFRGLTIAAMIVINNPGSGNDGARFAPLVHAHWHGCTPADLIFPFFVFMVGLSAAFSLGKRVQTGQSLRPVYRHILARSLTLFSLGLFGWFVLGWLFQAICPPAETQKSIWAIFLAPPADTDAYFYSLGNLRIPGVLQRLALVYLAVSLLVIHTRWRTQAMAAAALLLLYWGLMTLTPFQLTPGEDLGAFIDRALFGKAHLYMQTWDPEGLLSTLPAIATGILGALTGHWLKSPRAGRDKLLGLFGFGFLGLVFAEIWALVFPLNKNLWTSSYALYTASFAVISLGALYWLTDLRRTRMAWGRPIVWLGQNPLWAYGASQVGFMALYLLYIGTPAHHTNLLTMAHTALFGENWDILGQTPWLDPRWPSLYWAMLCLTFWTALLGLLDRKPLLRRASIHPAPRSKPAQVNFWDAEHIAGGYLGG